MKKKERTFTVWQIERYIHDFASIERLRMCLSTRSMGICATIKPKGDNHD